MPVRTVHDHGPGHVSLTDAQLAENYRLLPVDHPASIRFSSEMQAIHHRVRRAIEGDTYDPQRHTVEFRLSADSRPGAFIFPARRPPLVLYTIGMLKLIEHESELAALLAHELRHYVIEKRLGEHHVGKVEELSSDLNVPAILLRAHYPLDAWRIVLSKLGSDRALPDPFDPHLTLASRIAAVASTERLLVRGPAGRGEQPQEEIEDSPMDTALRRMAGAVEYRGFVKDLLHQRGFYEVTGTSERLNILSDVIGKELIGWDPALTVRGEDLIAAIQELAIQPGNPSHERAVNQLVEVMAHTPANPWNSFIAQKLYRALCAQYSRGSTEAVHPPELLGGFLQIQRAIEDFVLARGARQIREAAYKLNQLVLSYPFIEDGRRDNAPTAVVCHPQDYLRFRGC